MFKYLQMSVIDIFGSHSFLSCNCMILSTCTNKGDQKISVLFSHGPNKAFLVPDSCGRQKEMVIV